MTQDVIITPASGKIEFKNNAIVAATIVLDAANGRLNVPDTNTFHFLNTTGTAPFIVDSTTKVANLNSDLLDGLSSGSLLRSNASDSYTSGTLTIDNGAIVEFNMADGTAPFTVASTTKVSNLNADRLDGLSSASFASSTASPALTLSGDATGTATFTNLGNATLSVVVSNDSHTHDTRYFTESEVSIAMARALGWVNGYGNTVDASVYYDFAEQAVVIDKLTTADDTIGAVHKAVRVIAGEVVRYTLLLKADASHASGLYIRLYGYTGDLPDGKTHVSNDAGSSSSFVEEDTFVAPDWIENSAVGTGWITYEYEYTVPTTGYVSLVILNWTGTGADGKIWVKQPDIVIIKSASSANSDELQGFTWTETGKNVLGDQIQVGTATTYFYEDMAGRISTSADFYVRGDSANTYLYSPNTYLGDESGDSILVRGNTISGDSWSITGAGAAVFDSVSEGGTALSAKYLGLLSKAADSDKLDALNSTDFVRYIATPAAAASNLLASGAWITSWSTAENIDHVWHDDGDNQWNFNSDTTLYAQGNSIINGGSYKVGNVEFIDGSRNISANEIAGTFGEFTNDTDALRLRSTTTSVGVNINFSDQAPTPLQQGNITYFHADTLSYGSGNAFVISGTEASMTILADGKLMFRDGIYSKPSSGTGAGTLLISSSGNLTNIGTISSGAITATNLTLTDNGVAGGTPLLKISADDGGPWALQLYREDLTGGPQMFASDASTFSLSGHVDIRSSFVLRMNGSVVIDSSKNINNIGNIRTTADNSYLSMGVPGLGASVGARYLSIEGNADAGGEGSGRIFFTEHNSSTALMDSYGMSIGYRGGDTSIVGASGNTWTGLTQIANGQWGMWGHDNSAEGALIMYGDRIASFVDFSGNALQGIGSLTALDINVGTYSTTATGSLYLNGSTASKQAVLKCTNGNLHMDANSGNSMYLNYYSGSSIVFGNGASGTNASIAANGNFTTSGTISSGAITSTGNSIHGGYSSWTAGNGVAGIFMHYTTTDVYRGYFDWRTLQLGNNGANNILAGNTGTGGWFDFWVNATAISQAGGTSGIKALTLTAAGNTIVTGTLSSGTIAISGGLSMAQPASTNAYFEIAGNGNTIGSTSMLFGQNAADYGYCWNRANQILLFGTNNLERLSISATGDVAVTSGVLKMGTTTVIDASRNITAGTISGTALGVTGTASTTGLGISLYGGAAGGEPTYGLMFQGTGTFGTHGSVTGDWATYFTMNVSAGRGWIFRNVTNGNVASISNTGNAAFNGTIYSGVATGTDILSWTGGGIRKMTTQGGISIGADSSVMLHAGDSRASWATFFGISAATTAETLYCTADGAVQVVTNMQGGVGSIYTSTFGTDGSLSVPGTITSGGQELISGNVTGQLFANVISANEIYAGMIAANAIIADKIAANAITADKLEISSSASVADSIFFDGPNKRIDIKDASNVLRVRIGQL